MSQQKLALPISEGFYLDSTLPISAQDCINWIPRYVESQGEALTPIALIPRPALVGCQFGFENPNTIIGYARGSFLMDDVMYAVLGTGLYELSILNDLFNTTIVLNATLRGTLAPSDSPVSMASNGTWLVIVIPGGAAYAYNRTTLAFTEITDANYFPSNCVVFKDGYFVFTETSGDFFFTSEPNNPLVIEPLSITTAEEAPDRIMSAIVSHNELFIQGEQTIEVFQTNQSGDAAPFSRIPGSLIEKGVHSPFGSVIFDNTFVFIGGGPQEKTAIWKVTGSASVVKISTPAIEFAIQKFTRDEILNAFALAYSDNQGTFAIFTFTSIDNRIPAVTFVYDAVASAMVGKSIWHQRQTGSFPNCWNVASMLQYKGLVFVTTLDGNKWDLVMGVLQTSFNWDKSGTGVFFDLIYHRKTSQPFSNIGKSLYIGDVELTVQSGVGASAELPQFPGTDQIDPQMRMSFSDDGGYTWNISSSRAMGKIGAYEQRLIWRRNGRVPRYRCYRYETTAPVKPVIIKQEAWLDSGVQ